MKILLRKRKSTSNPKQRVVSSLKSPKPFRKREVIKNRKNERNKKIFVVGGGMLVFFSFLFTTFLTFIFLTQPPILSPIPKLALGVSHKIEVNTDQEIRRLLTGSTIEIKDIKTYQNNTHVLTTKDGAEIIFASDQDIKLQISSLQLIVSRLTMEGKRFAHLDLRYDKPVVKFK